MFENNIRRVYSQLVPESTSTLVNSYQFLVNSFIYQGVTYKVMYLFNELKYFNRFMFIVSWIDMHQFLFTFESISLKVAFKISLAKIIWVKN